MIEYVSGTLAENRPGRAVVDVQGLGYLVHTLPATFGDFPAVGQSVKLWTHYQILEDARSLYGFQSKYDRDVFSLLCSVSGIGPRMALKALSEHPASTVIRWIHTGDEAHLRGLKGLGPKLAAKLILDLKSKAAAFLSPADASAGPAAPGGARDETELALKNLGYKDGEVAAVLGHVFADGDLPLETAIRRALGLLAKR